jgi:hypothetical protein
VKEVKIVSAGVDLDGGVYRAIGQVDNDLSQYMAAEIFIDARANILRDIAQDGPECVGVADEVPDDEPNVNGKTCHWVVQSRDT